MPISAGALVNASYGERSPTDHDIGMSCYV
jgi:hypothetical protein